MDDMWANGICLTPSTYPSQYSFQFFQWFIKKYSKLKVEIDNLVEKEGAKEFKGTTTTLNAYAIELANQRISKVTADT